jgi:hypothetical protein
MDSRSRALPATLKSTLIVGGAFLASVGLVVALAAGPSQRGQAAAVYPPWWTQADVLASASQAGAVIGLGAVPFIVIVRAEGGDLAPRLRRSGALFTLDPSHVLVCGQNGNFNVSNAF